MVTDVCVVGSGAAGIALACELDGSATRVLVLEAGGTKRDPLAERDDFAIDFLGTPYRNPCATRGRWFGGSTNLWFGRIAMLDPIDFQKRPWVPHSGWPIEYDDLMPWVVEAGRILDVPNLGRIHQASWADEPAADIFAAPGGAGLGAFVWANGLHMAAHNRRAIQASHNVTLLLGATATELVPDETSKVIESVAVRGPTGRFFSVVASSFVLAAGGLENPRLLLASTRRSPAGIGNQHDVVGRYFMDHPKTDGLATVDLEPLSDWHLDRLRMLTEHDSPPTGKEQLKVSFSAELQKGEELLNHSVHGDVASPVHDLDGYAAAQRLFRRLRRASGDEGDLGTKSRIADDVRRTAADAPELARHCILRLRRRARPTRLYLHDQMEQEPDPSSRVTVDWRKRDRWGLPRLQVDWRIGEATYRSQVRMHQMLRTALKRSGIDTFRSPLLDTDGYRPELMEMKHPSGTTRMSASPLLGVVDRDLRVHGVGNLYIVGSSVFPTVGHANPTLLIVALAARLADHIGRFRSSR